MYEHLGDINLEDTSILMALLSSSIYKILSQISFGDVTIFNNEQILEGYKELLQIKYTNKDLAVLKNAFEVASRFSELYILIDYSYDQKTPVLLKPGMNGHPCKARSEWLSCEVERR